MAVVLVGASGVLGRLIATELARQGVAATLVGRDQTRLEAVARDLAGAPVRVHPLTAAGLSAALAGARVAIAAVPHTALSRQELIGTAARAGAHVVDLCPQPVARTAARRVLPPGSGEIAVVPGAGLRGAVGHALGLLAAAAVGRATEVHVAHTLLDRAGTWWGPPSSGARAELAVELTRRFPVLDRGEGQEEAPGEARRLAWFPRPVGPAHAVGIPGGEALTLPAELGTLRTARVYEAMPSWRAELLQTAASAMRWGPAARRITRRLTADRPGLTPARQQAMRWAVVAEAAGPPAGLLDPVARAWANGRDPLHVAATCAVLLAQQLVATDPPGGVLTAGQLLAPTTLLDHLAERTSLRWSVVRPQAPSPRS